MDTDRVETIRNYPEPTTLKELRSFFWVVNYGREFIKKFAIITAPLYEILKGTKKSCNKQIKLNFAQKEGFNGIKNAVSQIP